MYKMREPSILASCFVACECRAWMCELQPFGAKVVAFGEACKNDLALESLARLWI